MDRNRSTDGIIFVTSFYRTDTGYQLYIRLGPVSGEHRRIVMGFSEDEFYGVDPVGYIVAMVKEYFTESGDSFERMALASYEQAADKEAIRRSFVEGVALFCRNIFGL